MDISVSSLTTIETATVRRLTDQVLAGSDVTLSVEGAAGEAMLDHVADCLADTRSRVLRASANRPGDLSLSGLMAQVTGESDLTAQDDKVLEQGFAALTVLDANCDRIVLLVSDAQALQRTALRYIQFAARSGNNLRLVLAGAQGFADALDPGEFASLRGRLAPVPTPGPSLSAVGLKPVLATTATAISAPAQTAPAAVAAPRVETSTPARRSAPVSGGAPPRDRRLWAGVGLGMAASVALGIGIGRHVSQPSPRVESSVVANAPEVPANSAPAGLDTNGVAEAPTVAGATPAEYAPTRAVGPPAASVAADAPSAPAPRGPEPVAPTPAGPPPTTDAATGSTFPVALAPVITPTLIAPAASVAARPIPTTPKASTASPKDSDPTLSNNAGRRPAYTQPKVANHLRTSPARSAPEGGEGYTRSPGGWAAPPIDAEQPSSRAPSYIGTYTTDSNGIRTFRFGP